MRIALVHEFLTQNGGAERVLDAFHELWPNAPIYTSVYDQKTMANRYWYADVRPSSLQRFYGSAKRYRFAVSKFAAAFEEFDFRDFDVVISSSWAFAKGVITRPECCHICYCHTPARLAWQFDSYVGVAGLGSVITGFLRNRASELRTWDVAASQRVDYFIANSYNVARRIRKYYGRESSVIHAPVDVSRFSISETDPEDFYLLVGRMIPYKRMDVAVEAFTRLNKPLIVVGDGPHLKRLKSIAGQSVEFLGRVSDTEVARLMAKCKAVVHTGEEDFGIVPLEAMASGRPVIAFGAGGAVETVIEGRTGTLYGTQTSSSLLQAVRHFESMEFNPNDLRRHAEAYDVELFKTRILRTVEDYFAKHVATYKSEIALSIPHIQPI